MFSSVPMARRCHLRVTPAGPPSGTGRDGGHEHRTHGNGTPSIAAVHAATRRPRGTLDHPGGAVLGKSFKIGSIGGIPITVDASWFLLGAYLVYSRVALL